MRWGGYYQTQWCNPISLSLIVKKLQGFLIFQGTTPPCYMKKIQTFLKLVLDMFSTPEVMQTGNPTTYKHVSLMHHTFISF